MNFEIFASKIGGQFASARGGQFNRHLHTDADLKDPEGIFNDMKKYLEPKTFSKQLKLHILDDFFTKNIV